jgi:FtsP/CotA-like multicopper oxidase with cupredoxin domain
MINSRQDLPKFPHLNPKILLCVLVFAFAQICAFAQTPIAPVANPCPRPAAGSVVHNPHSLFSSNGTLTVNFSYQTRTDSDGRTLFCFMTPDGFQNPTLHVRPGDHLIVNVTNNTPASPVQMVVNGPNCGSSMMTGSSMNIHYHGTNTSPACHQDEVIKTLINSGQTFQYNLAFPTDEPPGLFWYHPHVHGIAEAALQGGASGALIVEGIQNLQPAVKGLRHRVLLVRDQNVAGSPTPGGAVPSWDLTLNNIPIAFPALTPAIIHMQSGEKQFWRVSNSSADSILDVQVQFDGVPQTIQVVGIDSVPTGSQDGTRQGKLVLVNHFVLPPAARVEFIVAAPPSTVKLAQLVTLNIPTGPAGDSDPARPLATIKTFGVDNDGDGDNDDAVSATLATPNGQRFEGLATANVTAHRTLYFSEVISDPTNPLSPTNFFITVDGATPVLFDGNNPPSIITHQGAVEDWVIQNRAAEHHEFHFHQIHFNVLSQNNFETNGSVQAPGINGQFLDMIQIPFWDGNTAHPYPSVTVRMDFRGPDVGDFVYHCHILGHEDNGMMAIIRVLPQ